MGTRNSAAKAKVPANNMADGTQLVSIARRSFEQSGLTAEQCRKLATIYRDLLIVDSLATVLRDALYERCEDCAVHYGNLIEEMGKKLSASWKTLDYMGCNTLANIEAMQGGAS
jgi:hypothetical protein